MKTKIIIEVKGGTVIRIISNQDIDYTIIDYDVDLNDLIVEHKVLSNPDIVRYLSKTTK